MATGPGWPKDELKSQFSEVGEWARHYSNVRMTVTPVLVALSLGIMQFAMEKTGTVAWIPMVSSLVLWAAAIVILVTFTYHTNRTTEHWAYIQAKLLFPLPLPPDHKNVLLFESQVPTQRRSKISYMDTPAWIGIVLTIAYVLFWVLWAVGFIQLTDTTPHSTALPAAATAIEAAPADAAPDLGRSRPLPSRSVRTK